MGVLIDLLIQHASKSGGQKQLVKFLDTLDNDSLAACYSQIEVKAKRYMHALEVEYNKEVYAQLKETLEIYSTFSDYMERKGWLKDSTIHMTFMHMIGSRSFSKINTSALTKKVNEMFTQKAV